MAVLVGRFTCASGQVGRAVTQVKDFSATTQPWRSRASDWTAAAILAVKCYTPSPRDMERAWVLVAVLFRLRLVRCAGLRGSMGQRLSSNPGIVGQARRVSLGGISLWLRPSG